MNFMYPVADDPSHSVSLYKEVTPLMRLIINLLQMKQEEILLRLLVYLAKAGGILMNLKLSLEKLI